MQQNVKQLERDSFCCGKTAQKNFVICNEIVIEAVVCLFVCFFVVMERGTHLREKLFVWF